MDEIRVIANRGPVQLVQRAPAAGDAELAGDGRQAVAVADGVGPARLRRERTGLDDARPLLAIGPAQHFRNVDLVAGVFPRRLGVEDADLAAAERDAEHAMATGESRVPAPPGIAGRQSAVFALHDQPRADAGQCVGQRFARRGEYVPRAVAIPNGPVAVLDVGARLVAARVGGLERLALSCRVDTLRE